MINIIPKGVKDLTGQIFGHLTVVGIARMGDKGALWLCNCSCGKTTIQRGSTMKSGAVKGCGCRRKIESGMHKVTHGCTKTKEYRIWRGIKQRCLGKDTNHTKNYRDRGIKMCDRWAHSFENFIADMGRAPTPKHSIDRRNNDGNYEPSNCRWATDEVQHSNKRTTRMIEINGQSKPLFIWCKELGLNYSTVSARIHRHGYSEYEALITAKKAERNGQPFPS